MSLNYTIKLIDWTHFWRIERKRRTQVLLAAKQTEQHETPDAGEWIHLCERTAASTGEHVAPSWAQGRHGRHEGFQQ